VPGSTPVEVTSDSTYQLGLAVDGLFHFTRWERLDPFLAVGVGAVHYGADRVGQREDDQDDVALRGGGGVMYHFNDEWALRADVRAMLVDFGNSPNANSILSAGVNWTWGARLAPDYVVATGPADSDGDGLTDAEERQIGTDPYDPDTDKDRLSDGQEVKVYKTDPLNPDTDWDYLKDGDEVLTHKTDPLLRDTDNGGVCDGHEVLEDGTNPLIGKDDLYLITLNIEFDTDKSVIRSEYFKDIDIVGKVLRRNPKATAVIEGHADKRKTSKSGYNMQLSERRARAVVERLATVCGIEKSRMKAVGFGYSRPKGANDPVNGNHLNRRVEVYNRGVDKDAEAQMPPAEAVPASLKTVDPANK
jgi:outer membrane protein OmpA-like peptidoglycan-associated protein